MNTYEQMDRSLRDDQNKLNKESNTEISRRDILVLFNIRIKLAFKNLKGSDLEIKLQELDYKLLTWINMELHHIDAKSDIVLFVKEKGNDSFAPVTNLVKPSSITSFLVEKGVRLASLKNPVKDDIDKLNKTEIYLLLKGLDNIIVVGDDTHFVRHLIARSLYLKYSQNKDKIIKNMILDATFERNLNALNKKLTPTDWTNIINGDITTSLTTEELNVIGSSTTTSKEDEQILKDVTSEFETALMNDVDEKANTIYNTLTDLADKAQDIVKEENKNIINISDMEKQVSSRTGRQHRYDNRMSLMRILGYGTLIFVYMDYFPSLLAIEYIGMILKFCKALLLVFSVPSLALKVLSIDSNAPTPFFQVYYSTIIKFTQLTIISLYAYLQYFSGITSAPEQLKYPSQPGLMSGFTSYMIYIWAYLMITLNNFGRNIQLLIQSSIDFTDTRISNSAVVTALGLNIAKESYDLYQDFSGVLYNHENFLDNVDNKLSQYTFNYNKLVSNVEKDFQANKGQPPGSRIRQFLQQQAISSLSDNAKLITSEQNKSMQKMSVFIDLQKVKAQQAVAELAKYQLEDLTKNQSNLISYEDYEDVALDGGLILPALPAQANPELRKFILRGLELKDKKEREEIYKDELYNELYNGLILPAQANPELRKLILRGVISSSNEIDKTGNDQLKKSDVRLPAS